MDSQKIVNILAGVLLASIGWWTNNIWSTVQSQQQQIAAVSVELAKSYAPRVEMQAQFDRIFSKLDEIQKGMK